MSDDKFKFDPTCRYGLRVLWKPIKPTKLEMDAMTLLPPSTRSQALRYVRLNIAETIPRGFRSKVKIRSSVIVWDLRKWKVFDWSYDPSS